MSIALNKKITIVIPTRERSDTLYYALKSCVEQDYENLRILVSDNASEDDTESVVKQFSDSRIQYVRTSSRVSMSENWEFALSHVTEGYVGYIGDDDALLPNSISELDRLTAEKNISVIAWQKATYYWPSCGEENLRNTLVIPVKNVVEYRDSGKYISEVLKYRKIYNDLPIIYSGLIEMEIIERAKSQAGRFFNSMTPDVYSGFAIASVISGYYFSRKPFSMEGVSGHSNGMFLFSNNQDSEKAAMKYYDEKNIPFHTDLEECACLPIIVCEAALQARDNVSASRPINVNISEAIHQAFKTRRYYRPERRTDLEDLLGRIAAKNGLKNIVVRKDKYPLIPQPVRRPPMGFHWWFKYFVYYGERSNLNDVHEAAKLTSFYINIFCEKQVRSGMLTFIPYVFKYGIRLVSLLVKKILRRNQKTKSVKKEKNSGLV